MITFKAKTPSGEIIKSAISDFIFPAGEAHIKVEAKRSIEATEIAIIQPSADSLHDDLFKLAVWNDYLLRKGAVSDDGIDRVLVIPYFPAARADRVSVGIEEPFGLAVYADFVNGLDLDQVIVFDPHSDVVSEMLYNVTVVSPDELFEQHHVYSQMVEIYSGIIAPDKGAVARATAVADVFDLPVYTAVKERDPDTGKLTGFSIDLPDDPDGFYLIVDDICDRGGTFLGLLGASGLEYGRIDLYVSHGVFSSDALTILPQKFEMIYTTNSYNPRRELNAAEGSWDEDVDYNPFPFKRFDVIHLLLEEVL